MNVDCARKENDKVFTLITKRIKRESTHCYVKSRRINYAKKIISIYSCVQTNEKKKQRSSEFREIVLRSTMCTEITNTKKNYL